MEWSFIRNVMEGTAWLKGRKRRMERELGKRGVVWVVGGMGRRLVVERDGCRFIYLDLLEGDGEGGGQGRAGQGRAG